MDKTLRCNKSYEDFAAADILKGVFDESTVVLDAFRKKHGKTDNLLMDLLAAGKMDEAVDYLPNNAGGVLLKNRYAQLTTAFTQNQLSPQEFGREQSKFVADILAYWGSDMPFKHGFLRKDGNFEMWEHGFLTKRKAP